MKKNVLREMFIAEVPCNWLQCMENSVDPVHLEWLHGYWGVHQQREKIRQRGGAPDVTAPRCRGGNPGRVVGRQRTWVAGPVTR